MESISALWSGYTSQAAARPCRDTPLVGHLSARYGPNNSHRKHINDETKSGMGQRAYPRLF